MPETDYCKVEDLMLDLKNYRTVPQKNEIASLRAIISASPDWFWGLTESLLEDGYTATENILVLDGGKTAGRIVKEGNRRIGALKLIHGLLDHRKLELPDHIERAIANISDEWRQANLQVPCALFKPSEKTKLDRIVTLTHGKGVKAGRDKWDAVARARHNRNENGASEPGLDLLEKYLQKGTNLTQQQRDRWGGDYPLTVLDDALKKIAPRLDAKSSSDLVKKYPNSIKHRTGVEKLIHDIGVRQVGFKEIRQEDPDLLLTTYGIPAISPAASPTTDGKTTQSGSKGTTTTAPATPTSAPIPKVLTPKKIKSLGLDDPQAVTRELKRFSPVGNGREKVVTLKVEAQKLRIATHPFAFCFVLRSMFEISAKAYCADHAGTPGAPSATKNGQDRQLVELLRSITDHLTKNGADKQKMKELHGAIAMLATPNTLLSVTSMNQLVHNPTFSVNEQYISTLFWNVYPLLREMNS